MFKFKFSYLKFKNIILLSICILIVSCTKENNNNATPTEPDVSEEPPSTPVGLRVGQAGGTYLIIYWSVTSHREIGFVIERKTDETSFREIGRRLHPNYSDYDLIPSTIYYYRVRAYNDYGVSDWSDTLSASTLDWIDWDETFYNIADTWVREGLETPKGDDDVLNVRTSDGDFYHEAECYILFDYEAIIQSLPNYAIIDSCKLMVTCQESGGEIYVQVGGLNVDWSEARTVWTNKPSYYGIFEDWSREPIRQGNTYMFNISTHLREYSEGIISNHGIGIKSMSLSDGSCWFVSKESDYNRSYRPRLKVYYRW